MQTKKNTTYDCVIIGGGLAGLCLSIQLVKKGHTVVVIEKNTYPFHKVCGEYISMESWNFIESLGLQLSNFNLPKINTLNVTAHNGYKIISPLALGGFGISRFALDYELSKIAKNLGVNVIENCKVTDVVLIDSIYTITTTHTKLIAKLVCGSYGKIEPLFVNDDLKNKKGKYIGVKYHVKITLPGNEISLHNFKNGYCGISKVDAETYCLCYLTTTKNLQSNNNDIKLLEKNVLMQNPHLKHIFNTAIFLNDKPLIISKISFRKKTIYNCNIIMLGDAAGAIAPLCGNGMSIAMRSSKILAQHIDDFLNAKISKHQLVTFYENEWNKNFLVRIKTGYYLQKLFGKKLTTILSLMLLKLNYSLFKKLIALTHGKPF